MSAVKSEICDWLATGKMAGAWRIQRRYLDTGLGLERGLSRSAAHGQPGGFPHEQCVWGACFQNTERDRPRPQQRLRNGSRRQFPLARQSQVCCARDGRAPIMLEVTMMACSAFDKSGGKANVVFKIAVRMAERG
jgi:hypothetical protein